MLVIPKLCFSPVTVMEVNMIVDEARSSLETNHAQLEKILLEELNRLQPDQSRVSQIKKQKLVIKDKLLKICK
ncbi:MAG: hypothetical protein CMM83_01735 [Rhodospirillales bacterium]|nr:hypothetical protein [Rhodospirillales bacterium]|tara:strand:+ start:857 stop:1075 length:219 start_codon:yes stop_codon:yes gene_type:complete